MSVRLSAFDRRLLDAVRQRQPKAYGVTIQDELGGRTGRDYSFGTIYAGLDRLETKGLLDSRLGEATAQRRWRHKVYYALTTAGDAAMRVPE